MVQRALVGLLYAIVTPLTVLRYVLLLRKGIRHRYPRDGLLPLGLPRLLQRLLPRMPPRRLPRLPRWRLSLRLS